MPATRLVVIDASVNNATQLQAALLLDPSVQILMLDPAQDALIQIQSTVAAASAAGSAFSVLDLFSAGSSGAMTLGGTVIDAATLTTQQAQWASIGSQLALNASLLLYGSSIAAGSVGQAFIDTLATTTGLSVAASTDATGSSSGANWVLESTSTGSTLSVSALMPAGLSGLLDNMAPVAQPMLSYATSSTMQLDANVVAVADINGDGQPDLLSTSWIVDPVSGNWITSLDLQLSNSSGGFDATQTLQSDMTGYGISLLSTADFNGDGKADVLTETYSTAPLTGNWNTTLNLQSSNNSGGLDPIQTQGVDSSGNGTWVVSTADINRDGTADLLTETWSIDPTSGLLIDTLTLRSGNVNGGLDAPQALMVDTSGNSIGVVGVADFNGDGRRDLLVNPTGSVLQLLANNGSGFDAAKPLMVDTTGAGFPIVAVADFTGDGKPDLLTESYSTDPITGQSGYWLQVHPGNSSGFDAAQTLQLNTSGNWINVSSTTDFNGDGRADLLIQDGQTLQRLISCVVTTAEDTVMSVTLRGSDANGSISSFTVQDLPQHGSLFLDAALTQPVTAGTALASNANALTLYFQPDANWNGLTQLSYVATDNQGASSALVVQPMDVTPVNDGAPVAPADPALQATLPAGTEDTAYTIHSADLLKGWTDVDNNALFVTSVWADHGSFKAAGSDTWVWVPEANYNGPLTVSYQVSDGFGGLTTATLNPIDIAPAIDPPTIDPSTITLQTKYEIWAPYYWKPISDINGDGQKEILSLGAGGYQTLQIHLSNPTGYDAPKTIQQSDFISIAAVGDYNGDGKDDILTIASTLQNAADGTFTGWASTTTLLTGNSTGLDHPQVFTVNLDGLGIVSTHDIDGDKKPDFLTYSCALDPTTNQLITNLEIRTSNNSYTPQTLQFNPNGFIDILSTIDMTGDGKLDIITEYSEISSTTGKVNHIIQLLAQNDNGYDAPKILQVQADHHEIAAITDVNSDNKPDIVTVDNYWDQTIDRGFSSLQLLTSNSVGFDTHKTLQSNQDAWIYTSTYDYNGDGKTDLITHTYNINPITNTSDNLLQLYTSNGNNYNNPIILLSSPANQNIHVATSFDFNKDGKPDLLTQIENTTINPMTGQPGGQLQLHLSNTTGFDTPTDIKVNTSENLQDAASGDMNGDGRTDIVFNTDHTCFISLAQVDGSFGTPLRLPGYDWTPRLQDVNGDGKLDILRERGIVMNPFGYGVGASNSAIAVTLKGSTDIDGTVTAYRVATLPAHGQIFADAALTQPLAVGVDVASVNGEATVYFKSDLNWSGNTSLSFVAVDNLGAVSAAADQFIQVRPAPVAVNVAPALTGPQANIAAQEDIPVAINLKALLDGWTDANGDSLAIDALSASNGSITGDAINGWTLTTAANFNGPVSLSYNVIDGQGGVTPATLSMDVTAVSDAPVLAGTLGPLADQAQNHGFSIALPAGLFTDIDSPVLTYSATLAGGAALPTWLKIDPATGTLSGTPTGLTTDTTYSLVVTASDGQLTTSTPAVSLKVFAGGTFTLTTKADTYIGTIGDEVIHAGAGNDAINAGNGNDVLDGGAGHDTLIGNGGNDVFWVDSAKDVVTEQPGEGIDTVRASLSYTLPANVENLILTGTTKINGAGNALDNVLLGNVSGNTLSGGSGNDVLCGGLGKDTLIGGIGNDQFLFNAFGFGKTKNADTIKDFTGGDVLVFDSAVFTALGSGVQTLRAGKGFTTAATATDHLIFNTTTKALYYDADGSGAASKPVQIATLTGVTALNMADVFIGNSTLAATTPGATYGHIDAATGLLMV